MTLRRASIRGFRPFGGVDRDAVAAPPISATDTKRLFCALRTGDEPDDAHIGAKPQAHRPLDVARALFANFGRDPASFLGDYGVGLDDALTQMEAHQPLTGLRATAVLLGRAVEASAKLSAEGRPATKRDLDELTAHLRRPEVITNLRSLYGLDDHLSSHGARSTNTAAEILLTSIDWAKLTVHRLGTTSLILRAPAAFPNTRQFIIKLVHFLFQGIPSINDVTRDYCEEVEQARDGCPHVAEILASGEGWVVQAFVPGPTVAEYISKQIARPDFDPVFGHLELLRTVFIPIVSALAVLHDEPYPMTHGDLNPSNIILQNTDIPPDLVGDDLKPVTTAVRFVDLGRNLLASDVIGRVKSPDTHFVAPEVITMAPDAPGPDHRADYYSLGLLLPTCLGVARPADLSGGQIPDALFTRAPLLARVMADLADPRPDKRLSVLHQDVDSTKDVDSKKEDLIKLRDYLNELHATLSEAAIEPTGGHGTVALIRGGIRGIVHPNESLRALARAFKPDKGPHAQAYRYLARWASIATATFWLSMLLAAVSLWTRYGEATGVNLLHVSSDQLRAVLAMAGVTLDKQSNSSYNQACAVGASSAFALYLYYSRSFKLAYLRHCTPRSTWLSRVSEFMMRLQTMLVIPWLVAGTFIAPTEWLWSSAAGLTIIAITTFLTLRRQEQVIETLTQNIEHYFARTPGFRGYWKDICPSQRLGEWMPMLFCCAGLMTLLAAALAAGYGSDYPIYAALVVAANVLGFGITQATRSGAEIAPSLTRTAVLAERWDLADSRTPG